MCTYTVQYTSHAECSRLSTISEVLRSQSMHAVYVNKEVCKLLMQYAFEGHNYTYFIKQLLRQSLPSIPWIMQGQSEFPL